MSPPIRTILAATLLFSMSQLFLPGMTAAADGPALADEKCAACHALKRPAAARTVEERMSLTGSDLFYAGRKYREAWIAQWLQNPVRIWPGGMFFANHAKVTDEGDKVDPTTLSKHVLLSAEEALAVSTYLMTLVDGGPTAEGVTYTPSPVSAQMGKMNFHKFKGCGACHEDSPGTGGVSGPQLYSAFERLRPDYITSYIRDPLAWDRTSLMPKVGLQDAEIFKLVDYLKHVSEENQ